MKALTFNEATKKPLEIDLTDKLSLRLLLMKNTRIKPDEHLFDVLVKVIRSDESIKIKLMKLLN